MDRDVAVKIEGLTRYYGKYLAVDHISLDIYDREIFGFLGPNGAGKTTTLLMLTTVLKPSEGTATVYGYDIRRDPDRVRELIGMAFQDPKLYWIHSPWEILLWHAKVCGFRGGRAKDVVREVLTKLDMWDARKKRAFELSGGMRKRVEIAKLFIQRPKLAIFDEPTTQIDVSGKHLIWDMIKELRDEGSTIILATNELYEADLLSDRVGIIHRGRIVALGSPSELKDTIPGGDILEIRIDGSPSDGLVGELERIPEVSEVSMSKGIFRIYLNRVEEVMPVILSMLMDRGVKIKSVNMREPSLDDVFLHYTGVSIKEAEGE
jgi:ABC-2 type transport system ATP-binding protein